jgi:hypothetical protein
MYERALLHQKKSQPIDYDSQPDRREAKVEARSGPWLLFPAALIGSD